MKEQYVILVNEQDEAQGVLGKMEAHASGLLHRAFSVFVFNSEGKMLLQRRAASKYHGAMLWSNTCCSHPSPGEDIRSAALRRLQEEMGFSTQLTAAFEFRYRAEVENGLVENEYDHVFAGIWNGSPVPDPEEVAAWRYESIDTIEKELAENPENFTVWFKTAFPRIKNWSSKTINAVHDYK